MPVIVYHRTPLTGDTRCQTRSSSPWSPSASLVSSTASSSSVEARSSREPWTEPPWSASLERLRKREQWGLTWPASSATVFFSWLFRFPPQICSKNKKVIRKYVIPIQYTSDGAASGIHTLEKCQILTVTFYHGLFSWDSFIHFSFLISPRWASWW